MTERGKELESYLRDGTCKVAWTYRRPAGDTVVMLRPLTHEGGICSSIWLSLRDPQDLALLRCLGEGEDEQTLTVDEPAVALAPLEPRFSPFTFLRGLLG